MALLDQAFQRGNLTRAWRWLQSNPEAAYKSYFRPLYANYRVAEDVLLAGLRDRFKRDLYEPAHACKIYFPKKSGGLRPYSLLTVEDQVVYQALVNIVAERLTPRIRQRHSRDVFSHIYAGKDSPWFYRYWKTGYTEMNRAVRRAFREGYRYAASFDLTACYDSVDHAVLCHLLGELGCDQDFSKFLVRCLSHWTATQRKRRIYHGHGIPQGPLSSGLLSEVVLRHFDEGRTDHPEVRYFRYVDDIRLLATGEHALRRAVAELDYLSKDIGLFPQSAKISIRRVTNIEKELKSVSRPGVTELDLSASRVDQRQLARRLRELSPKHRVDDTTEFTYLLSRALPRLSLTRRLIRVLRNQPHLYGDILRYMRKYDSLPDEVGEWLTQELYSNPVYAAFVAELINTADCRLDLFRSRDVDDYVAAQWNILRHRSADLIAALGRWGIKRGVLKRAQIEQAIVRLPEWWARAELVTVMDTRLLEAERLTKRLTERLTDEVSDVAIAAAVHLSELGVPVSPPDGMNPLAGPVLEEFGLIPSGAVRLCGITRSFRRLLGKKLPEVDWAWLFGAEYPMVERHAVFCYAYSAVNVTAWVNAMDVFNDWLLAALTAHDTSIGIYTRGKVGGFVKEKTSRFAKAYPAIWRMVHEFHRCRGESHLSHAWMQQGTAFVKPTAPVPYKYLNKARPLVEKAIAELAATWVRLRKAS